MLKWWRQEAYTQPKYPKGYVLERIAGECVDITARDHAEGFVRLLENIARTYAGYATSGSFRTCRTQACRRTTSRTASRGPDFKTFITKVAEAAKVARAALDETSTSKERGPLAEAVRAEVPRPPVTADASFPPIHRAAEQAGWLRMRPWWIGCQRGSSPRTRR